MALLDSNIVEQLKGYFDNINGNIELVSFLDDSEKSNELDSFLKEVDVISEKVNYIKKSFENDKTDLENHREELEKLGFNVYSVSTDTHFTHKAWHDHSEAIGKVKYTMIGDPTKAISREFEVLNEESGLAYRGTFVINPEGKIVAYEVNDEGIGRDASELVRRAKAAKFVADNPGLVCPAKWKEGEATLKPGLDLVGKI